MKRLPFWSKVVLKKVKSWDLGRKHASPCKTLLSNSPSLGGRGGWGEHVSLHTGLKMAENKGNGTISQ